MKYELKKTLRQKKADGTITLIELGSSVYENSLGYNIIEDYINRKAILQTKNDGGVIASFKFATDYDELKELLDAIYDIQGEFFGSEAYKVKVQALMPFEIKLGRDILSKDFQGELWFTGEFLESLLSSGANWFDLP